MEKVSATAHVINGFGKACGLPQVQELGQIETPIALTNTLSVWRVAHALAQWSIDHNPAIGVTTTTVNPVVAECNDGYLNDIQGNHIHHEHVLRALNDAAAQPDFSPVAEGSVGSGTGMVCYGWKGGIGTAGRTIQLADRRYTLGTLVLANFGRPGQLRFAGCKIPHWRELLPASDSPNRRDGRETPIPPGSIVPGSIVPGSIVMVLATDAPLDARQLQRLCVRATAGLARTGSIIDHGSGDFVIAFSTTRRIPHAPDAADMEATTLVAEAQVMHAFLPAVVETVEESVLNALCAAETMQGRDGHVCHALPLDTVSVILQRAA